jgi:hypothetical protein
MKHSLLVLLASARVAGGQVHYAFTNFASMPGGFGQVEAERNNQKVRCITPEKRKGQQL